MRRFCFFSGERHRDDGTRRSGFAKSVEGNGEAREERRQGRVVVERGIPSRQTTARRRSASRSAARHDTRRAPGEASRVVREDALSSRSARASRCRQKAIAADEAFHVASKYLSERGAAASGESGGRWHGARCVAVARASRVSIDAASSRSPIDRDARRVLEMALEIRGKETRSVGDRVGTDHGAGDAPAVLGVTSARRVISMRPAGSPPMVMSKKHTGLAMVS